MRPAGPLLLLLLAGLVAGPADEPAATAPAKTSVRLSQEIRATLPRFEPPAATPPAASPLLVTVHNLDPEVVELPKMTVLEKRLPGHDHDAWLNDRVVQRKAMVAYRDSMTDFEWLLNCWFVPLFSAPPSVRGREYYESRKQAEEVGRLNNLIKVIGLTDPKAAAKARRAMDVNLLIKDD
jgi:hypothetical protein